MCLLKSSNSLENELDYSCACNVGYKLSINSKDCEPIRKYLLYTKNNYMVGKDVDETSPLEKPAYPFPPMFVWGILGRDQEIAPVDYDKSQEKFYYADCANILQAGLDDTYRTRWTRYSNDSGYCINNLAYHSLTKKLYTTEMWINETGDYHYLIMMNISMEIDRFTHLDVVGKMISSRPLSLIVHPTNNDLYLLTFDEATNKSVVSRMPTDFFISNSTTFDVEGMNATGLALDHPRNQIYWYNSTGTIGTMDLGGTEVRIITESPVDSVNFLVVDDEWIYVKNMTCIWRIRKDEGYQASVFVNEEKNVLLRSSMKVVEREFENLPYGSDYSTTKEACKTFCLFRPKSKDQVVFYYDKSDDDFCKCDTDNLKEIRTAVQLIN